MSFIISIGEKPRDNELLGKDGAVAIECVDSELETGVIERAILKVKGRKSEYAQSRMAVFYEPKWESISKEIQSLPHQKIGAISA